MKLSIGTVQFGLDYGISNEDGQVNTIEARRIISSSEAMGIDMLDTAIDYGDSEKILGELGVESWKVVSKLPAIPVNCSNINQWVHDQTNSSLARLGVKQLHGLLLHRPDQLLEPGGDELHRALQGVKDAGLVNKVGISIYDPSQLEKILRNYDFDLVQAPLNIIDRRLIDSGWLSQLHNKNIEVHTRSVFLQGLLLIPAHKRPEKFNRWNSVWKIWDDWLAEHSLSPLEACMGFANSQENVSRIIVGLNSLKQLNEVIAAFSIRLNKFPNFGSFQDTRLINPATWDKL